MGIKWKTTLLTVAGVFLTASVVVGVIVIQRGRLDTQVTDEMNKLASSECQKVASAVYRMAEAHNATLKKQLDADLVVATKVLGDSGAVTFADERATWDAINQFTKQTRRVELPRMLVGDKWLGQVSAAEQTAAVVDDVHKVIGGTCTIFQRMNEAGDMLRVSTNVKKLDGKRAIGTYIPATNPDGTPNAVVSTLLKGETYKGRAYVVNAWYITAYQPIRNESGDVVGALYFGVPQENVPELRRGIMSMVVGKTGYVYVLGGSGNHEGDYLISYQGKRDGENILNAKDADGREFIKEVVSTAKAQVDGSCGVVPYAWKNPGETRARTKIAAVTYFEPW